MIFMNCVNNTDHLKLFSQALVTSNWIKYYICILKANKNNQQY